ncbi:MAG: hypothetical protein ABIQ09_12650 [Jatrophihabitantaceae bacterium]
MRLRPGPVLLADFWVLGLSVVLLWPQRLAGYGLGHDMVFTPRQPLTDQSFGLGTVAPRAVPLDAVVALAGRVLDGAVLGRIALLAPLLMAGWGCTRLLRVTSLRAASLRAGSRPGSPASSLTGSLPGTLAVAGFAVWNPFVVERLALGQWALLWAYGALPWVVRAASRFSAEPQAEPAGGSVGRGSGWLQPTASLTCWLACCAITPTGALIGAGVAVVVAGSRRLKRLAPVLAVAVLVQLPWLVPALTSAAGATSDPRGVAAFAARSERPGGAWASLLGLGGIWSSDVTPASRAGLLGYLGTAVVLAGLVFGLPALRARMGERLWRRLALLGLAGLALAAAGTLPGLAAVLRWAVRELPGAGLLRDGQKWLMPFVLLAVLSVGAAVQRLTDRLRDRLPHQLPGWPAVLAALALPLVLLPDAPATLKAPLSPVRYPARWQQVADQVRGSSAAVLVLPFGSYRSFSWAPGRTVLDPAPRWLPAETVVDDRLVVSGQVLSGEDPAAGRVAALLESRPGPAALASALAGQGIGWVAREADTPGPPAPDLSALRPVLTGGAVELYRVPGQVTAAPSESARRRLVLLLDLLCAALVAAAICVMAGIAARRLLHSPVTSSSEDS